MKRSEAIAFRRKLEEMAELQDDAHALDSIEMFPKWAPGLHVLVGKRYKYGGKLYRVIQEHDTQATWSPDVASSLFAEVSVEEWPEWVRPISTETAYNTGDKVTFEGGHYVCQMDGCVWSPSEYPAGWQEA